MTGEKDMKELPPDDEEPASKLADGRAVHEKAERQVDWKAMGTLSLAGIICGVCMWIAFSYVGGTIELKSLVGAIFGGWLSGLAIFALS